MDTLDPLAVQSYLRYLQESGVVHLSGEVGEQRWPETVPILRSRPTPARSRPVPLSTPGNPAPPPAEAEPASPLPATHTLDQLRELVSACQRCPLAKGRTQTVFGVGNPQTAVLFIGEAPGAEEDRCGEPFVGAAGKLLDKMIRAAGYARQDIYIANVIKCRPPGNRNPQDDEVAQCRGYLERQIALIRPRAIFALGRFAIQFLLGEFKSISHVRNRIHRYHDIPVIASYHPAYYLRQASWKRAAWEDLLLLMDVLEGNPPG